jgi:hypothetical protein
MFFQSARSAMVDLFGASILKLEQLNWGVRRVAHAARATGDHACGDTGGCSLLLRPPKSCVIIRAAAGPECNAWKGRLQLWPKRR